MKAKKSFIAITLVLMLTLLPACSDDANETPSENTPQLPSNELMIFRRNDDMLYAGIDKGAFEDFCGFPLRDNWYNSNRGNFVDIIMLDDTIVAFSFYGGGWAAGEIEIGDNISRVIDLYGEPDYVEPPNELLPDSQLLNRSAYLADDWSIYFFHTGDGIIERFGAEREFDYSDVQGTQYLYESGSGNKEFEAFSSPGIGFLEISYSGAGDFSITALDNEGLEYPLLSHIGSYSGRVLIPEYFPSRLSVTAEGDWKIISLHPFTPTEDREFFGEHDYVTEPIAQNSLIWNVQYSGSEEFKLIWHSGIYPGSSEEILVDTSGSFSGEAALDDKYMNATGFFEIIADGDWKINS